MKPERRMGGGDKSDTPVEQEREGDRGRGNVNKGDTKEQRQGGFLGNLVSG